MFQKRSKKHLSFHKKSKKKSIKNESIALMISKFKHKENVCHYSLNKAISEKEFYRIRKCYSEHNTRLT